MHMEVVGVQGRFGALLRAGTTARELHDAPLLENPEWVVAPTLGAIVPNWLIVVPKRPALNFATWGQLRGSNPSALVIQIATHLHLSSDDLIWFEHGPREVGTVVGCGLDYAHLHIIFRPSFSWKQLVDTARQNAAGLNWHAVPADTAYGRLSGDRSYLIVGSGSEAVVAENVEQAGSQFLRRMIAEVVGQPHRWNYRTDPNHGNIVETIKCFRSLERIA